MRKATVKEILTVQNEGGREVRRKIDYYNLDAIIAVGYRVNSQKATQFRIWATRVLREYIIKGYALDDGRWYRVLISYLTMYRYKSSSIGS